MGEAELAHDSRSLIPSLKWLETDLSDAVGRLQGLATFGDIQQEGSFLQRRWLAGRGQSYCVIRRCLRSSSGDCPMTLFQPPRPLPSQPVFASHSPCLTMRRRGNLSSMRRRPTAPRLLRRYAPRNDTSMDVGGTPKPRQGRIPATLLGFSIWSLVTQGDSPLCTPSQVRRPNEFSIPLSGRILGRVVG